MAQPDPAMVLEIKKYPNRRLYDATRSCHVTTGEIYDLVAAGQTVRVRDSKSGEDITNQVLLQALIERDPLKINAVPPPLVHLMIRMNQPMMASWFDQFLRWTMDGYQAASRAAPAWWAGWPAGGGALSSGFAPPGWGGAGGPAGAPPSPMAWLETFMRTAGAPAARSAASEPPGGEPEPEPGDPGGDEPDPDLEQLREQVAALAAEIAQLRSERDGGSGDP